MSTTTKRKVHITKAQKIKLQEFLAVNHTLRTGKFTAAFTAKDAARAWEEIACQLNAIPGARKHWKAWRKTWQDLFSKMKSRQRQTGDGPPPRPLTEFEESVATLIEPRAVSEQTDSRESNMNFDSTAMYCHLCRVDDTATHDSSPRHRVARQLAAAVVERLSNHVAFFNAGDEPKTTGETEKTAVSFCDCCNAIVSTAELSSHLRQRTHTLALLNDQTLEELVSMYVDEVDFKLLEAPRDPPEDSGVSVDRAEAVKTYSCHFCALDVSLVFKTEHERGSRHRASRALAAATARRVRDMLSRSDDKSKDRAEDQSKDASKDTSDDRPKFTGEMMKKLLRTYTRRDIVDIDEDEIANVEEETEPTKTEKRLTAKEYFKDILPYISYIGTFCTLIIDDTEFVTVKIGRDTLKIHVNHINGLYNYCGNDGYYMNCRLCDGFNNKCYTSSDEQDKMHVMSLGHIRNVLSPIDNVHLIRKIDETHSTCALCNVHIPSHLVENHIMKDPHHTTALTQALERGKEFKESKEHLKIMVYTAPINKPSVFMKPWQFNNDTQNRWPVNLQGQNRHPGTLFGSAQNNRAVSSVQNIFGGAQSQAFNSGLPHQKNSVFGNAQNFSGFGIDTQNKATGFGAAQNTTFGAPNTTGFGVDTQNKATGFGAAQNTTFGAANTTGFGVDTQIKATGFGAAQNNTDSFGSAPNPGFGVYDQNKTASGALRTTGLFGGQGEPQNVPPQKNNSIFGNTTSFVSAQNTTGLGWGDQNKTAFGDAQTVGQPGFFKKPPSHQNNTDLKVQSQTPPSDGVQNSAAFGAGQTDTQPGIFSAAWPHINKSELTDD